MKPYSENPSEAKGCKYAKKSKRIGTRVKAERIHKKRARKTIDDNALVEFYETLQKYSLSKN